MPVYNGSNEIDEVYYGSTKIGEAYYGNTKVYASAPLYYCYKRQGDNLYVYCQQKITTTGWYTFGYKDNFGIVSASSQFEHVQTINVDSVSGDTIGVNITGFGGVPFDYYKGGDLKE